MAGIEYEAKALEVDPEKVRQLIDEAGGEQVSDRQLQRRYVYDTIPALVGKWVRLRDTGQTVTLCVKQILSDEVDGTHETEVVVSDFAEAHALLQLAGLAPRTYQENYRTSYRLGAVRLEVDEWPSIPPYLEVEADSEDEVWAAAARLGIARESLTSINTTEVYAQYGIDLHAIDSLRFE
ncbi:class IV adenylate cyclase [Rhizohabitans arisaemae]|uniref:class IV adenylate cyclase n=1 Tax=Rhizohabitans arisaemae TaxID=2720610 RepID=UPI0024B1E09E|nr:CYTH domain-containing protein [Rhizohabitans arisaemae]